MAYHYLIATKLTKMLLCLSINVDLFLIQSLTYHEEKFIHKVILSSHIRVMIINLLLKNQDKT